MRKDGWQMRTIQTVFEKSAPDVDLMAVIDVADTFNRKNVDSMDVTDKDVICQMFRKWP